MAIPYIRANSSGGLRYYQARIPGSENILTTDPNYINGVRDSGISVNDIRYKTNTVILFNLTNGPTTNPLYAVNYGSYFIVTSGESNGGPSAQFSISRKFGDTYAEVDSHNANPGLDDSSIVCEWRQGLGIYIYTDKAGYAGTAYRAVIYGAIFPPT